MHEFSIAVNIIDIAVETANANDASVIKEVEIEVGELSGVIDEALDSALKSACRATIAENAVFVIRKIESEAVCTDCGKKFVPDDLVSACPNCGSVSTEIVKGKELRVKSINVE